MHQGQAVPRIGARVYYSLALLVGIGAINFLDRQVLSILMEPIKHDLKLNDTQLGLLSGTAFAFAYVLASFPIARWADRGNRRNVIAYCALFWSGMTALCGLALSFFHLIVARIGVAVGESGSGPATQSLVSDLFPPRRRGMAMAAVALGSAIGIFLGLMLGGILNTYFDWRTAFIVVSLPGILLAFLVLFTIREPQRGVFEPHEPAPDNESIVHVFIELWRIRTFRYTLIAIAVHAITGYAWTVWGASFFVRVHEMDTHQVGIWLGLSIGTGVMSGALLSGFLVDYLAGRDERWYVFVPGFGSFIAFPVALIAGLVDHTASALMLFVPLLILSATWGPPSFALTQTLAKPRMRAVAATLIGAVTSVVGYGLGPLLVGMLSDFFEPSQGPLAIRYALLTLTPALVASGLIFMYAGRFAREDFARARRTVSM